LNGAARPQPAVAPQVPPGHQRLRRGAVPAALRGGNPGPRERRVPGCGVKFPQCGITLA